MAAALGVPVVSVFGPTSPEVFRPYTDRGVVLDAGPDMQKITPDEIVAATRKISGI
jgi:ADP-heptose:LPS heptosyltransferase